jgi:hypothetical protein
MIQRWCDVAAPAPFHNLSLCESDLCRKSCDGDLVLHKSTYLSVIPAGVPVASTKDRENSFNLSFQFITRRKSCYSVT